MSAPITAEQRAEVLALHNQGLTIPQIREATGVGKNSIVDIRKGRKRKPRGKRERQKKRQAKAEKKYPGEEVRTGGIGGVQLKCWNDKCRGFSPLLDDGRCVVCAAIEARPTADARGESKDETRLVTNF